MHECDYKQTNFSNGVIKYYCKKGFIEKEKSFKSGYGYI